MKKILYFLCFIIFFIPIYSEAIVTPTNEFYINDYANILSNETETYILQRSLALNEADGTQIVVVTIPNLEGMSLEKYANDLFNSFGIGDSEKDNGLLLLLALEERMFRVEVGDGLSGILPDGKTGRFQDNYIIPYLREDKWDEGIKNGYDAFYAEIVTQNNLSVDYTRPIEYYTENDDDNYVYDLIFLFGTVGSYFLGTVFGIKVNRMKKKKLVVSAVIISCIISIVLSFKYYVYLFPCIILFLIAFIIIVSNYYKDAYNYYLLNSRRSSGYFSSHSDGGFSSGGGFSGGGGSSSGGGSSRRF